MKLIRSTGPYFIPQELDSCIDFVGGVLRFPKVKTLRVAKPSQDDGIVPAVIKQVFNMPADIHGMSGPNSQVCLTTVQTFLLNLTGRCSIFRSILHTC
jgi:hypothetical protein